MRRIGIMVGSNSDLPQCLEGLLFLQEAEALGRCKVISVDTCSQHRNTTDVQDILTEYVRDQTIDVLITGAGWANHLSGCCDAFLRNTLNDTKIVVYGVAFEDSNEPLNTQAAVLSITRVPGLQLVYAGVGSKGFRWACVEACSGTLPVITLMEIKPCQRRSLYDAITLTGVAGWHQQCRSERILKGGKS